MTKKWRTFRTAQHRARWAKHASAQEGPPRPASATRQPSLTRAGVRGRHKRGEDVECDSRGKPEGPSLWSPAPRQRSSQARTGPSSGEAEPAKPDVTRLVRRPQKRGPRAGVSRGTRQGRRPPSDFGRGPGEARGESPPHPAPALTARLPGRDPLEAYRTPPNKQRRRAAAASAAIPGRGFPRRHACTQRRVPAPIRPLT